MVVDATGIIRYFESGFMGHLNDAQTFGLMRRTGTELCFPEPCVLLGDKIYPNRKLHNDALHCRTVST